MRNLNNLNIGEQSKVKYLSSKGSMRRRMLDLGITENTRVECIGESPFGDPRAFLIRGAVIAIRSEDCNDIIIDS